MLATKKLIEGVSAFAHFKSLLLLQSVHTAFLLLKLDVPLSEYLYQNISTHGIMQHCKLEI